LWTLADTLRDRLTAAGIEVRDTPQGAVWLLAEDQRGGRAEGSR
jgi:cysteinyl-tRNA synthetase